MRRYKIENLQEYAKLKGGAVIETEFFGIHYKYSWVCEKNHEFKAWGGIINRQTWCKDCAGLMPGSIKKYDDIAKSKGGRCLSNTYVNNHTKLLWECANGHQFQAKPNSVQQGYWCAKCAGKERKTIQDCQAAAKKNNGYCLSNVYVNNKEKLLWQCEQGHQWYAPFSNVNTGAWCKICAKEKLGLNLRRPFNVLSDLAKSRGGRLLSLENEHVNGKSKLNWMCAVGHKFNMAPENMFTSQMSWCPTCSEGRGERLCRYVFERIFKLPFSKIRPIWLNKLELDGYNEDLKIAFEHQGRQHYLENSQFYSVEVQQRDKVKRQLCIELGIILIEIPELFSMISVDTLVDYVVNKLVENDVDLSQYDTDFKITDEIIYKESVTEENNQVKRIIESKLSGSNFEVLEFKFNRQNRLEYTLRCANGHLKKYFSSEILKNQISCHHCNYDISATENVKNKLLACDCKIVKEYTWKDGLKTRPVFQIECSKGHKSKYSRDQILKTNWRCRYCQTDDKNMAKLNEILSEEKFICIEPPHFRGKRFRLRLRCINNHEFYVQFYDVINGKLVCNRC